MGGARPLRRAPRPAAQRRRRCPPTPGGPGCASPAPSRRAGWSSRPSTRASSPPGLALQAGKVDIAKRELARASSARTRGTVERRTRAWHAEALLRLADGDRVRARRAVRTGLRILEEHRAMLGATDLRAAASAHRVELARLAFTMAVEDGDATAALRWLELSRAGLLRLRGVRPPDDVQLAAALAQLRATLKSIDEAVGSGERIGPLRARADPPRARDPRPLPHPARRRRRPAGPAAGPAGSRRTAGRAGPGRVRGRTAASCTPSSSPTGRAAVRSLGPAAPVAADVRSLSVLLDRLARGLGGAERQQATLQRFRDLAAAVDARVLAPLASLIGDRPLVLAPDETVRPVPWFALPTVSGRPVTVVPSGTVWFEAADRARPGRPDRRR